MQLQNPARAGLERLAVSAVHGAKTNMFQSAFRGITGQFRRAEHLRKMVSLTLIDAIEHQMRVLIAPATDDGGQIGRAIHGRAFG